MRKQPIHQNLNTSFVNVGALVRYLRGLQFVGSIRLELSSYEADIVFTSSKKIVAREYDHIAGRISHGEQALQRILIRAREPHGRIHVYKSVAGAEHDDRRVFVDKSIVHDARQLAASHGGTKSKDSGFELVMTGRESEDSLILGALSELLRMIDETLAKEKLSFAAAFRNSCEAIASDYPFMNKKGTALVYEGGEIHLNAQADVVSLIGAVFSALRPIFYRLRDEEKYAELFRGLKVSLRESSQARRSEYVRLGLMSHIETLLND